MISPEQFDKWRVVPRLLTALYGWICYDTHIWFLSLPNPTSEQQLYANIIWGAAAAWFGLYVNSGNKKE
jgi:hypothetical protein